MYDVIVVGLGAMGSATTYQLAKRGVDVLGIDQFSPPHIHGSTHGETRVTRQGIFEFSYLVPYALRSHEIWREVEAVTGADLLNQCGLLLLQEPDGKSSHGADDIVKKTAESAQKYGVDHELLSDVELKKKYPQLNIRNETKGYYERGGGFVRPEACVKAQLQLAEQLGATLQTGTQVSGWSANENSVHVDTDKGQFDSQQLIITAGPWIGEVVPQLVNAAQVYRQTLVWYELESGYETAYAPENFPVYIWGATDFSFYGFPALGSSQDGMKFASERYDSTTTPDTIDRNISEKETQAIYESVAKRRFEGVKNTVARATTCMYTVLPEWNFVIDNHPDFDNVIIASPCSGHGFKHSAAIGETLAELAITGESTLDVSPFKIDAVWS
jgi:sarcosine oxidase